MLEYDLFVVGGGSGGVRAARVSAGLGARVGLAEGKRLGGTCVNVGCVPKKLLVYAASFAADFVDAAGFGWRLPGPASFSWPALIANKNKEIERLNGVYRKLLTKAGVEIHDAHARFLDAHTLQVGDEKVRAKTILVATGGHPWKPPIPGNDLAITSREAFYLEQQPESIVIAGGGYIGVEFAGIFAALGSEVHLVHKNEHLLNAFDEDIRKFLEEQIRINGVHLHLGRTATSLHKDDGRVVATLDDGSELGAQVQMMAVGRRPNTEGLGLEAAGVQTGARGAIIVDDELRTNVEHIYALGDVIDRVQLTPVALAEGMAFARARFGGEPMKLDYADIATAVFSNPPVASVGLSEEAAWHRGETCTIYRSAFRPMRNTLSGRPTRTMMKLVVCSKTDRVLGCHMVGPDAGEIIQGLAVAMKCGATKAQFDATVGIHPTAAEEFVTMRTPVH